MIDSPKSFSFFDVDDTLINIKSVFSFQVFWYDSTGDETEREAFNAEMSQLKADDAPRELMNTRYYSYFAGREVAKVEELGEAWFQKLEKEHSQLYQTAIVARMEEHRRNGVEPVFVSGSFPAVLKPSARRLGVKHILATRMEVLDGVYTGRILPPQTIGDGKATAVRMFLEAVGVDASSCYAYGDDISDRQMLAAVGYPYVVAGGRGLEDYARENDWPILHPLHATTA